MGEKGKTMLRKKTAEIVHNSEQLKTYISSNVLIFPSCSALFQKETSHPTVEWLNQLSMSKAIDLLSHLDTTDGRHCIPSTVLSTGNIAIK